MKLVPFTDAYVDEAAQLLALRLQACRSAHATIPATSAEPAPERIRGLLGKSRAAGVAALDGARLIGYMLGNPETTPAVRGRSAWTHLGGQAVAPDQSAALYADMYAWLFPQWLEAGNFAHYAMVPAEDRAALDAWFSLGFGMEQVHAIVEAASGTEAAPVAAEAPVQIRQATAEDLALLEPVIHLIAHHQVQAPCWAANLPEADAERVEGWAEALADKDCTTFVALDPAGRAAGFAMLYPADPGLMVPGRTIGLDVAATRPDLRGQGYGVALTRAAKAYAHEAGFTHMVTDWRSTNLLSSRFWPRQGFRPTHFRLYRQVDEKILWAR
ncbi:MAG: Acetyltransferase, family [Symbiobacteriaceae bacterium]|nr:Acetyltransferase, family [Symbiobacteriaceae bacterium]